MELCRCLGSSAVITTLGRRHSTSSLLMGFWLFEPRCGFHDIGGWYVETYGKDKKGRTIPSQRFWDGLDYSEQADRRLHPAMYLFALAYRTLDLEYAKISKRTFRNTVGAQMFKILHWCRKLV